MIIFGLLLLIAAVIFGAEFVFSNHHHFTNPAVFGQHLGLSNDAEVFIVGVITGAAVLVGLTLIMTGLRRKAVKAVEHHHERKDAKGTRRERDELARKNDDLRNALSRESSAGQKNSDNQPLGMSTKTAPMAKRGAARIDAEDAANQ
jgi:hypothetical protein